VLRGRSCDKAGDTFLGVSALTQEVRTHDDGLSASLGTALDPYRDGRFRYFHVRGLHDVVWKAWTQRGDNPAELSVGLLSLAAVIYQ
jgi:hypothetical protein